MTEAEYSSINQYANFSEFFTRKLKLGARILLAKPNELASPADGTISQIGDIKNGRIFQAKGFYYNLLELVGNDEQIAERFTGGSFATIYLSPQDYHRVHMPCDGALEKMVYIPGDLFSVNKVTTENIKNLFTRNERVVNFFNTSQGDVAVIMIGAMIVGSMSTTWCNTVSSQRGSIEKTEYNNFIDDNQVFLQQGDEMGKFDLGSTIILLFNKKNQQILNHLAPGVKVQIGQPLTMKQTQ